MAKKKEELLKPCLTKEEYWEWRTTIADMTAARSKLDLNQIKLKLFEKESELIQTKAQLHTATLLRLAQESLDSAKSEYQRYKKLLENRLGQSLDNCVIDDVTFEVKSLETTTI